MSLYFKLNVNDLTDSLLKLAGITNPSKMKRNKAGTHVLIKLKRTPPELFMKGYIPIDSNTIADEIRAGIWATIHNKD